MKTTCNVDCDFTITSTFAAVVYPIIEKKCMNCHNDNCTEGGAKLNNYTRVKANADSGTFTGTIEYRPGYPVMPTSGIKLSDCDISLLNQWMTNGALDN